EKVTEAALCVEPARSLYLTGAKLFREALAEKPALGDDMETGHRYNAACCAARAGTGQSKDAANLTDADRAAWGDQALDWLRADLSHWRSHLSSGLSLQSLRHWRVDDDLAGVRTPGALAKLPAEERQPWTKLWDEVNDLVRRAELLPSGRWRVDG